jgi:hypothetical protein
MLLRDRKLRRSDAFRPMPYDDVILRYIGFDMTADE